MKLLYSDKRTGMTASIELDSDMASLLLNRKIGSEIDASPFGLTGYTLKITGGSDSSGFPLDRSIAMQGKVKVVKMQHRKRGSAARRVVVRGNAITADVKQVSAVITAYGSKPLEGIFPKKAAPKEAGEKVQKAE